MAFCKRAIGFLLVMALFGVSFGAVYKVGDSNGWTNKGSVDYKHWSSSKNFTVGDTILFKYNDRQHNVMQVTHKNYQSCNAINPIATANSGNDSVVLEKHGHFFYICGVPGHCEAGQKVDIRVSESSPGPSSSQIPEPSPSPSSNRSGPNVPPPKPNGAPKQSSECFPIMPVLMAIGVWNIVI